MKIKKESIYEINAKNKFVKFKTDAMNIGKIIASFVEYNNEATEGSKVVSSGDFYIDLADAKLFANYILSGKMKKLCNMELEANPKYPQAVWKLQGGISAEGCKERGLRTDGKCLARVMSLSPGSKYPFIFKFQQGAGKRMQKDGVDTLIIPDWGKTPEVNLMVACTDEDLRKLALMINTYIDAYVTLSLPDRENKKINK